MSKYLTLAIALSETLPQPPTYTEPHDYSPAEEAAYEAAWEAWNAGFQRIQTVLDEGDPDFCATTFGDIVLGVEPF